MANVFDWHEINALIKILRQEGVGYLWGSEEFESGEIVEENPGRLLQRLVTCDYPLVENAGISLLLLHPDLSSAVLEALYNSEQSVAEKLAIMTLATLYLQQWWFFRLTFAFGTFPCFPETPFETLWEERHLPAPSSGYGLDGLLALQEYQQQRCGVPLNFLDDWQNQINHLLAQEEAYQRPLLEDQKQALIKRSMRRQAA